jgi:hypothetical protein
MNITFLPVEGTNDVLRFIAMDNGVRKDGAIIKQPIDTLYDRALLAAATFGPTTKK